MKDSMKRRSADENGQIFELILGNLRLGFSVEHDEAPIISVEQDEAPIRFRVEQIPTEF